MGSSLSSFMPSDTLSIRQASSPNFRLRNMAANLLGNALSLPGLLASTPVTTLNCVVMSGRRYQKPHADMACGQGFVEAIELAHLAGERPGCREVSSSNLMSNGANFVSRNMTNKAEVAIAIAAKTSAV
jgi:hypothetical protein